MVATSKNIQGNTELTLIAPLKPGLAPKPLSAPSDLSFAARVGLLLTTLFGDRKRELEADRITEGLLEELQVIHSVQWLILPAAQPMLMLAVTFDGPWEPYIRTIVESGGPLLDMIFSHCVGYEGNSCEDGYQKFSRWVRDHQIGTQFLFAATPTLTTDDARYLQQLEATFAEDPARSDLAKATSRNVLTPLKRRQSPHWLEKVVGLAKLGIFFGDEQHRFDRMSSLILRPEFGVMTSADPQNQLFLAAQQNPDSALAIRWFQTLPAKLPPAPDFSRQPPPLVQNRADVQGSLLTPYFEDVGGTTHGCVALLRFRSRPSAAAFLENMSNAVTTEPAEPGAAYPEIVVNFGLTLVGLQTLGVGPELLAKFPKEFQEGLAQRAGMLGDIGKNSPRNWDTPANNWPAVMNDPAAAGAPVPLTIVDAVVMLQTRSTVHGHGLLPELATKLQELADNVDILHVQPTRRFTSGGHFNLLDGLSQPTARGDASAHGALPRDQVALGELLLGYPNQRGEHDDLGHHELFRNSTFMALRNMKQDVEMYDSLGPSAHLALGRDENGVSLETPHLSGNPHANKNDFSYPASPDESRCPFFAHVRRANPRTDSNVPRILRRGMSYGPLYSDNPRAERGLLFIAYAASLAEQYEVVQRWVNAGNSTGVLSAHPDVIAGPFPENSSRNLYFANGLGRGQFPVPERQLSTLKWGLYAFVPSRTALQWLANGGFRQSVPAPQLPAGPLLPINDEGAPPNWIDAPPTQHGAYAFQDDSLAMQLKVFMEGGATVPESAAYWRGVQQLGGVRSTPFAVLVGSRAAVRDVLVDPEKFSVRSYWKRMTACQGQSYLGMDPNPVDMQDGWEVQAGDYARESRAANAFVGAITREQAFNPALAAGRRWLQSQRPFGPLTRLDLFAYARTIIRDVGTTLFDLPETFLSATDEFGSAAGQVRCPFDLTTSFLHIFPPRPSQAVSEQAATTGPRVAGTLESIFPQLESRSFIQALRQSSGNGNDNVSEAQKERERRTLLGVLSGFAVPTYGHLASTLVQLVQSNELWRLQREHDLKPRRPEHPTLGFADVSFLYDPIYACMIRGAVPERIHRTATSDTELGGVPIRRGDLLAVSIAAAAQESAAAGEEMPWKYLFGDLPESQAARPDDVRQPVHRCPAQDVAIGVLVGALLALLEHHPLIKSKDENDSFTLYSVA
ncbi:MAG TPA: hypothetical protein VHB79_33305 [Polyangiaceae bacterium]|nr:hypothetical protein [Polyangiaceae bacterium]